jgi:uncharacterized membrane protein
MIAAGGPLTTPAKVFLILHVTMAVIMVGAGYVYPLLLRNMKERGSNRVGLMRVTKAIANGFTKPFIYIQPLTGLGLILTTRDRWDPFEATNRWLFAAIVLFILIFILDAFVATPAIGRMQKLAEAGDYDAPAFESDLGKLNKVGPILGILFLTITVLMIWKPGGPDLHF